MARTDIHHEERKREIAEKLWSIFLQHGYESTTLALIIQELGISKGAFYHYFPTKEACADEAVDLFAGNCAEQIEKKLENGLTADKKMEQLIMLSASVSFQNAEEYHQINSPNNAIFHEKLMAGLVKKLAPVYASVIEQGITENRFHSSYPMETAQMILTLSNFFFDDDLFHWEPGGMKTKLLAFQNLLTLTLQADPEAFSFLKNKMAGDSI